LKTARFASEYFRMTAKTVALLGTLDTKGEEFGFLRQQIQASGVATLVIDAGVLDPPSILPDISRKEVARAAGDDIDQLVAQEDRGQSVDVMARGAARLLRRLFEQGRVHGLISLGGSAGTTIGTAAMRALPVGFPKVMVSTLASGNTRPFVGTKDILMLYPVLDIAGLNFISRRILSNAAAAIVGMVRQEQTESRPEKPVVAATMFGVTTPCVTKAREMLEARGYEVLVFHATGTGGQAMESLIADGAISAVLDITTTELADELVGGILSAGPDRLTAAGAAGIPQVVCPGAIDMVNFGPPESVPESFKHRLLYAHNPHVTLMRTTPQECAELGRITAEKLNRARGPVTFVMPLGGVSAVDAPGKPFYSPAAVAAYLDALKQNLKPGAQLVELDAHINDDAFATEVVARLLENIRRQSQL
jgi:uncharacterized protein (UPF0261 family)